MSQRSEEDEEKLRLFKMRLRGNTSSWENIGKAPEPTGEAKKRDDEFVKGLFARAKFLNEQKKNKE